MTSKINDVTTDEMEDMDSFTVLDEIGDGPDVDFSPEPEENLDFAEDEQDIELASGSKENNGDEVELEDHQSDCEQMYDETEDLAEEADEDIQAAVTEKNEDAELAEDEIGAEGNVAEKEEHLGDAAANSQNVSDDKNKSELKDESTQETADNVKLDNLGELKQEIELEEDTPEPEVETHPYLYLIENFEVPKDQLTFTTVGACKSLTETPVYIISTRPALIKLLQSLRNAKEIAVDLQLVDKEYKPLICLIEISTKNVDYIIDAQKLKNEVLLLTEIFINPKIVKIMFRAEQILACLQQRLRLYVVNIFDVEKAKLALDEAPEKFRGIFVMIKNDYSVEREKIPNADFRFRPLSDTYKNHCRFIPHYLIYMYHDYKNKLLAKDSELYNSFLSKSRDACKILYEDSKTMALQSLEAELKTRHSCELEVLKKLVSWRNTVAQKTNMRIQAVLPRNSLMSLVQFLPIDEQIIMSFCNTEFVKRDVKIISNIIFTTKIAFHVYQKKSELRKRLLQASIIKDAPQGLKRALKRKINEQNQTQNKQTRLSKIKNAAENNFWKQKQGATEVFPNRKYVNKNRSFQNLKTSTAVGNNFKANQFLNQNMNIPNTGGPGFSRFELADNMQLDNFNSSFGMNMQNTMRLNPTNIPSTVTFQSPPSQMSGNSSDRNRYDEFDFNSSNNYPNFSQKSNRLNKEQEMLQRSLKSLKQARDNIRRQTSSSGNFGNRRFQDLNAIDQKINTLGRKVTQIQSRNNRNRFEAPSRRRY